MKNMKKMIAMLMALTMMFALVACGSKEEKKEAEETPEYVYASKYTTIAENSETYLNPRAFTDSGFYSTSYEKVGENIPEGVTNIGIYTFYGCR